MAEDENEQLFAIKVIQLEEITQIKLA